MFFSSIYILYHRGKLTLVHKHVYVVYSAVLGLQFACMRNPNFACEFLICMCASCTRLACTRELCTAGLMSSVLHAHAGLHAYEMKNVSCRALAARVFCQVEIELYHNIMQMLCLFMCIHICVCLTVASSCLRYVQGTYT